MKAELGFGAAAGAGGLAAGSTSALTAKAAQQHKPAAKGKQGAGDAAGVQPALDAAVAKLFQQHPVLGIGRVRCGLRGACKWRLLWGLVGPG